MSKSSNNSYSYTDSEDTNLTANGNFELDEQQKRVLSANGNIFYNGMSIANFSTSMYNGILQYQLSGARNEIEICFSSYKHIELINIFRTIKI